jgi:hypothetical protein
MSQSLSQINFQDEFRRLLTKYGLDVDERYQRIEKGGQAPRDDLIASEFRAAVGASPRFSTACYV